MFLKQKKQKMYNKSFYFVSLLLIIANSIGNSHQNLVSSCTLNNSTVCSYENGNKACCPVKNAVCCRDSDYCCPEGKQSIIIINIFNKYFENLTKDFNVILQIEDV